MNVGLKTNLTFFGRDAEQQQLRDALISPGISLISGNRGLGRSAFIKETLDSFNVNKLSRIFYADLSDAVSPASFIVSLARQTLSVPEANQIKQLRELSNFFTYLRPIINVNKSTGLQQLDFSLDDNFKLAFTLEQIFNYYSRQASKVIVVLDEFNQVQHFRDEKFVGFFKEISKQNAELRLVVSVADSKRWNQWLQDAERSFIGSALKIQIGSIEHELFKIKLIHWFADNGKKLNDEVADYILDWSRLNTSLTIKVASLLLKSEPNEADLWFAENLLNKYLHSQRDVFQTYRRLLTVNQWLLLSGIAKERGARMVMGGEFVRKYGLGSPSSVQTALDALYDKELVYEEEGRLYLEDVALSRWMEL